MAVVVPAHDEAAVLPRLLDPLAAQLRPGDELVVVDDQSSDDTAAVAAAHGAAVIAAPDLPVGWIGKPHACWVGATATIAPTIVFLDADVRPGAALLDGLGAAVAAAPDAVVSVQPWHDAERFTEQATCLADVVALMGSGAFTVLGRRPAAGIAYGPVLSLLRDAPTSWPAAMPTRTSGRASSRTSPSPAGWGAAISSPARPTPRHAGQACVRRWRHGRGRWPSASRRRAGGSLSPSWPGWPRSPAGCSWAGWPIRSARRRSPCSAGGRGASGRSRRWRTRSPSSCSSSSSPGPRGSGPAARRRGRGGAVTALSGCRAAACRRWRRLPSTGGPRRPRPTASADRSPGAGRRPRTAAAPLRRSDG